MQVESLHTIGILGGMSSAATSEYYKLINDKVKARKGGYTLAEMIICSVNFANIERFVRENAWDEAGKYLAEKAKRLEAAGAGSVFLATNTMHRVRAEIQAAISIPFIDIFETVSAEIKAKGLRKVGILGTYPVMTDAFFREAYAEHGIELVSPGEEGRRELDRIIFEEMTQFQFLPTSKAYFLAIIEQLAQQGAEGVILGCTEIKLLINQADMPDFPFFDTTDLHCERAAQITVGEVVLS